ncbi:MAG: aspartate kinase [Flavobacteriales bacterium]
MIHVFKFGGASVKDAAAVRNMTEIVRNHANSPLIVVVSAMGKTTNAIEHIHKLRFEDKSFENEFKQLVDFHQNMVTQLFGESAIGAHALQQQIEAFNRQLRKPCEGSFDEEYDSLIGYGELFSTAIVEAYFQFQHIPSAWLDARNIIITDSRFRDARVDWQLSGRRLHSLRNELAAGNTCVIQGFIGSTTDGRSTSLGREGSDFTASIMAYLLDAEAVTIWKDVPGMLNADPKKFNDTVKLDRISFKEAIELAYYGASVIHPKTIKPLQNKGIPLYIKSFIDPGAAGSVIQESTAFDHLVTCYIVKENQVLMSISTRDFSFIVEDNLKEIFETFSQLGIRIHLMENSAISFSVVFDDDSLKNKELIQSLQEKYVIKFNNNVVLLTIRHGSENDANLLTSTGTDILLEEKNRNTIRIVLKKNP